MSTSAGEQIRQNALVDALRGIGGWMVLGAIVGAVAGTVSSGSNSPAFIAVLGAILGGVVGILCEIAKLVAGGITGAILGVIAGGLLGQLIGYTIVRQVPIPESVARQRLQLQIAGPTLDGQTFDLERWRGKVVLIDFWATWCKPCIDELPNLRGLYERRHGDGFEVVGVSLDNEKEKLAAYVKDNDIPWPQIFFDEPGAQGWDNPLARKYGINAIPATALVDSNGKVAFVGLRGEALEPAVVKLLELGSKAPPIQEFEVHPYQVGLPVGVLIGCLFGLGTDAVIRRLYRLCFRKTRAPPQAEHAAADQVTAGDKAAQ